MARDSTILFATFGLMLAVLAALWREEARFYTELPLFLLGFATFAFLLGGMAERATEQKNGPAT